MRRGLLRGLGLLLAFAPVVYIVAWAMGARPYEVFERIWSARRPPIIVGLIHSQSGPLAISEKSLIDAEMLAMEEINARGGVAGRRVEARVADGRSDASTFASEARRLLDTENVSVLFGSYTAESRKAVRAVVEERRGLLILPGNYEGMEQSPRVIYAGGSANQSVIPAVRWCFDSMKARRFFVAGTEEVWSRSVAEIAKDAIKAAGAEVVGESYLPLGGSDVEAMFSAIKAANPDVVLNGVVGESNVPFYAGLRKAGLTPDRRPVVSFSISEDELRRIPPADVVGHYAAWNYFQSVDREENREFVRKFKAKFGADRVTSDAIVAAYNGVMLWAQAADEARTADSRMVLDHLGRQSLDAPEGIVTIDPESRVVWRPFRIGRARTDGQFDVIYSLDKPCHPITYTTTRSKAEWQSFLDGLRVQWGGHWSSTGPSALMAR